MEHADHKKPGVAGTSGGRELAKDVGKGLADSVLSLVVYVAIIAVGIGIAALLWSSGATTAAIVVGIAGFGVATWKTGWFFF